MIKSVVRNIFLVGFMASGKTSVGIELTRMLRWPLIDGDDEIVRRAGKSIEKIFQESGEEEFRLMERGIIIELCRQEGKIITPGGGAFVDETNRSRMLESGEVFCLTASPTTIYQRLAAQRGTDPVRPLLEVEDPLGRIQELMAERRTAYSQAHHTIQTDELDSKEIANLIALTCGLRAPSTGV